MDAFTSETSGQKKDPFEDLSREELIKKCRQFLAIAQKAKQAKDELTIKLDEVQTKSENDVKVMQEMLNVLTDQKLELVTKIDIFQKEKNEFKDKYETSQKDLQQVTIQMQDVDTENQGCGRQVRRLTEENDQLIIHLDTLEKQINELNEIGEQQREQLLLLEKQQINNSDNRNYEEMEELQLKCSSRETEISDAKLNLSKQEQIIVNLKEEIDLLKIKNEQIVQLKNYCQLKSNELESLQLKNRELIDLNNKNEIILTETKNELINTKQIKENYNNEKCKMFNKNIQQISTDVLELKKYGDDILLVFQSYEQYINTWKTDILQLIKTFGQEVQNRDMEIEKLKLENNYLNNQNINLHEKDVKINNLVDCNEKLNIIIEDYKTKVHTLKNQLREKESMELNVAILTEETIVLQKKYEEVDEQILLHEEKCSRNVSEMQNQISVLDEENSDLKRGLSKTQNYSEVCEKMRNKNRVLLEENNSLKISLSEAENNNKMYEEMRGKNRVLSEENNNLKTAISVAENYYTMYEEMQNENRILNEANNYLKISSSEGENNTKMNEEMQNENRILNEENHNLKRALCEADNNSKVYEEMRDKKRVLHEENNNLKSALSEAENNFKLYEKKVEEDQHKNRILHEENNNLKSSLSEVENNFKVYEKKVEEETNKNRILNEENINLKSSLFEAQNNSKVYEEKVAQLRNITEKKETELVDGIIKFQEEKIVLLSKENNLLKQTISGGAKHLEMLTASLSDKNSLESENLRLKSDLSDEKEKNSDLRTENTVARKLNMELQQTSTSLEEAILRNVDFLKIIEGLRDQIENHYIGKKVFENASKSLTALNEMNTSLKDKINKYEENLTSYSRDCSDLRNQLSLSKRANVQLLEEMNEMNLALKERGETISKLQEIYQELQKQTKTLEQESQTWCKEKGILEQEVSSLKESQISAADREENTSSKTLVAEKQKIIQDLEREIKLLKESLNTSIGEFSFA